MTDEKKEPQDDAVAGDPQSDDTAPAALPGSEAAATQPLAEEQSKTLTEPDTHENNTPEESSPPLSRSESRPRRKVSWWSVFLFLLILIVAAVVAVMGWHGYQFYLQDASKSGRIGELQQQLTQQQQQLTELKGESNRAAQALQRQLQDTGERLQAAEQRLTAQNKRLLAMSTITREDWLLAEAEYLLKLANQRVLIERNAVGAESLLTEADNILRDLDDPDLFALRKAVNNDLAALRLVQKIDSEGIYLQINGLIEQVTQLPIKPDRNQVLSRPEEPTTEALDSDLSATGWWHAVKANLSEFGNSLKSYIQYDNHSEKPKPILAPESAQYLQQNVRLMLERAQLAMLREQQAIYQNSLLQAEKYLADFYPNSAPVQSFRNQLQVLSQRNIEVQLPDITGSLELLHSYIETLHNLKGAKPASSEGGAQ